MAESATILLNLRKLIVLGLTRTEGNWELQGV